MISVSHKIRNHVELESVIIMIGVLLGEKSNEKAVLRLPILWYI